MGTIWSRVETSARASLPAEDGAAAQPDLEPGLQARIADPLWMLARQWQLGEFRGEDAASPVRARAEVKTTRPTLFVGSGKTRALPATGGLLEPQVEAENLTEGAGVFGRNAEAGLHLLRLLDAGGVGTLRSAFRTRYPLASPVLNALVDSETQHRVAMLFRRSLNAQRFASEYAKNPTTAVPTGITATQLPKVTAAITTWTAWLAGRFVAPDKSPWKSERMEYNFGLAAAGAQGPVELSAAGYPGGHLDWSSFDIVPNSTQPIANTTLTATTVEMLPSSVRYRGMPASRFWEFEEGTVQFGGVSAGPTEPARLVVAEFATVFGDDWYMIPIPLTANTLARVTKLEVINTFGETVTLKSCAELDGVTRTWRFFELTGDDSVDRGYAPWLYIAPAVVGGSEGRPVERVLLARDEGANLAWAIERRIEGPLGAPIDRAPSTVTSDPGDGTWRYQAESATQPYWIPLVPVVKGGSAQYTLRRGRMADWGTDATAGAQGTLLTPGSRLDIREEEVPSEGVVVTRAWQLARNADGSLLVWLGHKKQVGKGEARSGLRFDRILGVGGS